MVSLIGTLLSIIFLNVGIAGLCLSVLMLNGKFKKLVDKIYFDVLDTIDSEALSKSVAITSTESVLKFIYITDGKLSARKVFIVTFFLNVISVYALSTFQIDIYSPDGQGDDVSNVIFLTILMLFSSFLLEYISAAVTLYFASKASESGKSVYYLYDAIFLIGWVFIPIFIIIIISFLLAVPEILMYIAMLLLTPILQLLILFGSMPYEGFKSLVMLPSAFSFCVPTIGVYVLYRLFGTKSTLKKLIELIELLDKHGAWRIFVESGAIIGVGAGIHSFV